MVTKASHFLGHFRWAFMPLGLCALVAVGVHAAADTIDDRLLWAVERLDAVLDGFFGQFDRTAPLVDMFAAPQRTAVSRALALFWEIACDGVLLWPLLGYRERDPHEPPEPLKPFSMVKTRRVPRELLRDLVRRPTVMRLLRPLFTALVALAGAGAIARMLQGRVFLSARETATAEVAQEIARGAGLTVLVLLAVSFGFRATVRAFEHADAVSTEAPLEKFSALRRGLTGTAIALPVATAAVLDFPSLLAFFR